MSRIFYLGLGVFLLAGCATHGVVDNRPATGSSSERTYSTDLVGQQGTGKISLILSFSGGGTRAAALAYGVMLELRDTRMIVDGIERNLLGEVDVISSVSGGSFTAAYYGLFGDQLFEDFEEVFLKRNVQAELLAALFNPLRWFSSKGRTEIAIDLYQKVVFRNKTYADMRRDDSPLILINASDLFYGVRFSFVQEYFDLLCSDLNSFPVARAVAASSAVPVLFNPIVLENYPGCETDTAELVVAAEARAQGNAEMVEVVRGLRTYADKDQRRYAHFVDGGITDNLGLRAVYEIVEVAGGVQQFTRATQGKPPRRLIVISVDAATKPEPEANRSTRQPSLEQTVDAVSSVQLHRYNAATIDLMQQTIPRWAQELSTPGRKVEHHFIRLGFSDIQEPESFKILNLIPTSFGLSDEQVERLIDTGRGILRNNEEFQRLLAELGNRPTER
jgi:NTE family protein